MERIIEKARALLASKGSAVIALDGRAAAGKTTLAASLAERLNAEVIHMDDFFLPPELRTAERLSLPGGNVHYERFSAEVADGILSGKPFEYSVFDCSIMGVSGKKRATPEGVTIVEGAYALHPQIPDIYDIKVFVTAPLETRLERILLRNGGEKLEAFRRKWIPLEEAYFSAFDIENKCDIIIEQLRGL